MTGMALIFFNGNLNVFKPFLSICLLLSCLSLNSWAATNLSIVYPEENAPFSFTNDQGEAAGVLIDIWRLWAAQSPSIPLTFKQQTWSGSFEQIQQEAVDIHVGIFHDSEDQAPRNQGLSYSEPLLPVKYHFFFHKSLLGVKALRDLLPFRIGVIADGYSHRLLLKRLPNASLQTYQTYSQLYKAAHRGEIKAFISPLLNYRYFLNQGISPQPYRYHSHTPLFTQHYRAAVKQNQSALLKQINARIKALDIEQQRTVRRRWLAGTDLDARQYLLVAANENNPPFSFTNEQGEAVGLLLDFWRLWAKEQKKQIEFIFNTPSQSRQWVREGLADFHVGSRQYNNVWANYSDVIYRYQQSLFHLKKHKASFDSQSKIAVLHNDDALWLKQKYPNLRTRFYQQLNDVLEDLTQEKLDGFFGNALQFQDYLNKQGRQGDFVQQERFNRDVDLYALLRGESNTLVEHLNQGLDELKPEQLLVLERQWLSDANRGFYHQKQQGIWLSQAEKKWLKSHPRLIISGHDQLIPLSYFDKSKQAHQGVVADYLALISQYSGLKFMYEPGLNQKKIQRKLGNDSLDVVHHFGQMDDKDYLSTDAYLSLKYALINRRDVENIADLNQLNANYAHIGLIQGMQLNHTLGQDYPNLTLSLYQNYYDLLHDLTKGRLDAALVDDLSFNYYQRQKPLNNLKIAGLTDYQLDLNFIIGKDKPLLQNIINKSLRYISVEEQQQIIGKWIPFSNRDNSYSYLKIAFALLLCLVIIAIFSYWNYRLRHENQRRKHAEAVLRHSREQLQLAMDAAALGTWDLNLTEGQVYWNEQMALQHGFNAGVSKASLQAWLYDCIHKEDRRRVLETFSNYMENRIASYQVEYRTISNQWVMAQGRILERDNEGMPLRILGISQNISQRKQNEAALAHALNMAEQATQAKSEFLANMSHEIRTPMNAIIGMTHLTLETQLSPKQKNYLRKIDAAAQLLLGIINDILDFSKIEAGKLDIELIEFKLDDVLDNLAHMLAIKADEKNLEILFSRDPDVPTVLKGDPLRLGQILINLVNNAIKFTETGEIIVHSRFLRRDNDQMQLEFSVKDTGIGIEQEKAEQLFDAFHQADKSTTRRYGGSGLGLSICKRLVEMMNGKIWLESTPGEGSTFYFSITLGCAHKPKLKYHLLAPELRHIRILVIDDNRAASYILSEMLNNFSFQVTVMHSGEEGIAELQRNHNSKEPLYRIVLLDWKMPDMDGLETARQIRQIYPAGEGPSLVMVTGYGHDDLFKNVQKIGLDGYLIKPINPSVLFDTLVRVLDHSIPPEAGEQLNRQLRAAPYFSQGEILLVEDNLINQQVAEELLDSIGLHVTTASHGLEAIEALNKQAFDLILMDIQMPEMDGFTATAEIRQLPQGRKVPIVAMTAHASLQDKKKCLEAGMDDHIAKPIEPHLLFATLAKWLQDLIDDKQQCNLAETTDNTELQNHLPEHLPGINLETGLYRVNGNHELLLRLLQRFYDEHQENMNDLHDYVKRGQLFNAQRLLHSLQAVSGNVGAMKLSKHSYTLETLIKQQTSLTPSFVDMHQKEMKNLENAFHRVFKGLEIWVQQQTQKLPKTSSTAKKLDLSRLKADINHLHEQTELGEVDALHSLEAIKEQLEGHQRYQELLMQLRIDLENYDFDEALAVIQQLQAHLFQ